MRLVLGLIEHDLDGAEDAGLILRDQQGAGAVLDIPGDPAPERQRILQRKRMHEADGSAAVHTVDQDVRKALDLRIRHAGQSPDGIGAGIAAPHRPRQPD